MHVEIIWYIQHDKKLLLGFFFGYYFWFDIYFYIFQNEPSNVMLNVNDQTHVKYMLTD